MAELTYKCPLECVYCSNPLDFAASDKQELNTQDWCSILEQARELGAVQLGISGGEPAIRKDLETILEKASSLGFLYTTSSPLVSA